MEQGFKRAYDRLNDAQRQAVDQIEGPVLVIAGPGTGKTQLLSLRIANILNKTDTLPEHKLCASA
jgi:DNA helicase-2/ATP-dependent DNA helicase PcrA